MSLKKINNKLTEKQVKIQYSMQKLLQDKDSAIFCDYCNNRLGILRMIWIAKGIKKGNRYLVPCKVCKKINMRLKGEVNNKIENDWAKYGFSE